MEELPYVDKIVSKDPEETKGILRDIYDEDKEFLRGVELEKSHHDLEIIDFATKAVDEYLNLYGRTKETNIPIDHIHIFKEGGLEDYSKGKNKEAVSWVLSAQIILDRKKSDVELALRAFHELVHVKSFTSVQDIEIGGDIHISPRRSGFLVTSPGSNEEYFVDLMEAVIELMTVQFYKDKVVLSDLFKDEIKHYTETNTLPDMGRPNELIAMNNLIDDLFEKQNGKYQTREEILDLFIRAQVNGRLLELARLVESVYGKGSFVSLAEGEDLTKRI